MTTVEAILKQAKGMRPLSEAALRMIQLAGQPEHSLAQLAELVAADAALTASVLKVANSAAFRPEQPVTSLTMALSRLGDRIAIGIAIGTCASHLYDRELAGYESPGGALWRHSLRTAIAARELSAFCISPLNNATAYTAGLLHDLGKCVVSDYLKDNVAELMAYVDAQAHPDFLEAERSRLGTDHCEAGAALAGTWKLPEVLCEALRHHHAPMKAKAEHLRLVFAVHIADIVAMAVGDGTGIDSMRYPLDPAYAKLFSISATAFEKLTLRVQDEFDRIVNSLLHPDKQGAA